MKRVRKDLRLYLALMLAVPTVYTGINLTMAWRWGSFSSGFALLLSWGIFGILFALDAVAALAVRYLLPQRWLSPFLPIYRVGRWETRLFRKMKIGKWQAYIPEMGELAHFKKDHLRGDSPAYLLQFLTETVYAEVMHGWSVLLSVVPLFLFSFQYLYCILPLCILNACLQIPPIWIQRYNRPMLQRLYQRKTKKATSV